MKIFKSRKLSILLALALVLTSFSFTAMAAEGDAATTPAEDFTIIGSTSDIGRLTQVKGLTDKDTDSEYFITTDANYQDELLNKTVLKYSATKYGISSGTWNTAGTEPRIATDTAFANAGFTADKYDYVKIEFNIYIADKSNGLAFRMQRYTPGVTDMGNYCYIGVGGSDFKVGGGSLAGSYINTGLTVGKWNNVVIELGANTTNKDVIFHINGVSTVCETKLPDNTYGFGGGNSSRSVMIPKGYKDKPFEIRLDDFSIVATNTKHIYSNGYLINDFKNRNTVSSKVSAIDFSETYNKKALRVENNYFKTTDGVKEQTPLGGGVGQEAGFILNSLEDGEEHKQDIATLGDLDWSEYKNLRIQFNAYFDYENIIYFRFVRSLDGGETYDKTSNIHVVGVGTPAKPGVADNNTNTANTSGASSGCNYRYREMTPNEWHNVVMELGANKDNKYINIYIDGKKVSHDNKSSNFVNADTAEGFGAVGRYNLVLSLRDTADSFLNAQISDISFTACKSMYTSAAAPEITGVTKAEAAPTTSTVGLSYRVDNENKKITYVKDRDTDGMSVADFKVSNVDYVAPTDSTNTKVIAYNDASKRVAYYTLEEQTDVVLNETRATIVEDGRICIEYDYNNDGTKYTSFKAHVACYKNDALVHLRADTWCNVPEGLSAATYDLSLPKTIEFDKVKVFLWAKANETEPFPINPVIKSAEVDVVK